MATAITKKSFSTKGRVKKNSINRPQPVAPVTITAANATGLVLTVTFNQPVALSGVPQYTTDVAGADAVSAALTSPTTVAITFDATITAATLLNVPHEEPAIRSASGGFVSTSTFPC